MRGLVELYKKNAGDLIAIKKRLKVPFLVKGVFRAEDVEMMKEVRPDIVIVSNHGGRVETDRASTAGVLARYGSELARYAGEVWVDGGLRSRRDLLAAAALGASEVLIGRPLVTALLRGGGEGVKSLLAESYGFAPPSRSR